MHWRRAASQICCQITTDDLRGWMAFETRDHARSSMARKVVSVRSFFAWAHEHGRIEADPAAVLMTPKLPDTLPSVLTEAQAERLMDRVDDDASLACRLIAALRDTA